MLIVYKRTIELYVIVKNKIFLESNILGVFIIGFIT